MQTDSRTETGQRYNVRSSPVMATFLVLSVLSVLVLIGCLPLASGWRLAAVAGVSSVAGFVLLRDVLLRCTGSWVAFELGPLPCITVFPRKGPPVAGRVGGGSFVSPGLTLINVTTAAGKRRSLIVMPDSMAEDDFRRLRVQLRWSGQV